MNHQCTNNKLAHEKNISRNTRMCLIGIDNQLRLQLQQSSDCIATLNSEQKFDCTNFSSLLEPEQRRINVCSSVGDIRLWKPGWVMTVDCITSRRKNSSYQKFLNLNEVLTKFREYSKVRIHSWELSINCVIHLNFVTRTDNWVLAIHVICTLVSSDERSPRNVDEVGMSFGIQLLNKKKISKSIWIHLEMINDWVCAIALVITRRSLMNFVLSVSTKLLALFLSSGHWHLPFKFFLPNLTYNSRRLRLSCLSLTTKWNRQ